MLVFIETNVAITIKRVYDGNAFDVKTFNQILFDESIFDDEEDLPKNKDWEIEHEMATYRFGDTVYIFLKV